jgi:hypothetical protein
LKLREAVTRSNVPLPSAYKEFILKFGNAKLYRNARNDSYRIGVFAGPRQSTLGDGTRIYIIGWNDGASVYVKPVSDLTELPIFEFEEEPEEKVADSFEEWLAASCANARRAYGKEKWAEILRGPKRFTAEEKDIIEARRLISWRVLGIDADGNHIFEVTNAGCRALAALTVGVRSKDGRLNSAIRLNVLHIGPGQRDVLHRGCCKGLRPPEELELFALPDPNPEDRDYYWELSG